MADRGYELPAGGVPVPPESSLYVDLMRWCVCVMDADDPELYLTAGLLEQAIKCDGLTNAQMKIADRIHFRVHAAWTEGRLRCQRGGNHG